MHLVTFFPWSCVCHTYDLPYYFLGLWRSPAWNYHLTENAKKELAAAAASDNSKLYYVIATGESLVDHPRLKPGKWVLLSPEAMGHSFKLDGKEMMMVESFHVAGVITYHEEADVESQYLTGVQELQEPSGYTAHS